MPFPKAGHPEARGPLILLSPIVVINNRIDRNDQNKGNLIDGIALEQGTNHLWEFAFIADFSFVFDLTVISYLRQNLFLTQPLQHKRNLLTFALPTQLDKLLKNKEGLVNSGFALRFYHHNPVVFALFQALNSAIQAALECVREMIE